MWSIRSGFSLPYILAQMFYTYYGTIAHNHILALAIPIIAVKHTKHSRIPCAYIDRRTTSLQF